MLNYFKEQQMALNNRISALESKFQVTVQLLKTELKISQKFPMCMDANNHKLLSVFQEKSHLIVYYSGRGTTKLSRQETRFFSVESTS